MAQDLYEFVELAADLMQFRLHVIGAMSAQERTIVNAEIQAIYLMEEASRDKAVMQITGIQSKTSPDKTIKVWFEKKKNRGL